MGVLRYICDGVHSPGNENTDSEGRPGWSVPGEEDPQRRQYCGDDCHSGGPKKADQRACAQAGKDGAHRKGSNGETKGCVCQPEIGFDLRIPRQKAGKDCPISEEQNVDPKAGIARGLGG